MKAKRNTETRTINGICVRGKRVGYQVMLQVSTVVQRTSYGCHLRRHVLWQYLLLVVYLSRFFCRAGIIYCDVMRRAIYWVFCRIVSCARYPQFLYDSTSMYVFNPVAGTSLIRCTSTSKSVTLLQRVVYVSAPELPLLHMWCSICYTNGTAPARRTLAEDLHVGRRLRNKKTRTNATKTYLHQSKRWLSQYIWTKCDHTRQYDVLCESQHTIQQDQVQH